MNTQAITAIHRRLLDYCEASEWSGNDPYDALNSPLFSNESILNRHWPRLIATQLLKRSPIDLRSVLRIPKHQNPKGLALFLSAYCTLTDSDALKNNAVINQLVDALCALRSSDSDYWCWGYSFPWQTRTVLVPRGASNLVCTVFVANSFLDLYDAVKDPEYLEIARSSADFILKELYWSDDCGRIAIAYPFRDSRTPIHNASLLGAALISRVGYHVGDARYSEVAGDIAVYATSQQQNDGSWFYGESSKQKWIDNFHTGYNLCALRTISEYLETNKFHTSIEKGFDFYKLHFFSENRIPKYFHNRTYPVDIHCVAQSIITLVRFSDVDSEAPLIADNVLSWAISNMWEADGFFIYQISPRIRNKISYMRWSQAWMVLALSMYLKSKS